jgi:hypothetical protein
MALRANDLKDLVKDIFEIDNFKSKLGDDNEIVVLSFTVDYKDPADDLEHFFEMGYEFVLDADVTAGEMDDGRYKVFVELERGRHVAKQIFELVEGLKKLSGLDRIKFRYYKSFKSYEATEDNLDLIVPKDGNSYKIATDQNQLNNFSTFFGNSFADEISIAEDKISFVRDKNHIAAFNILECGITKEVYNSISGPIMLESKDIAEVLFLTKCIGNYNITKVGDKFIFENSGYAVALEKV